MQSTFTFPLPRSKLIKCSTALNGAYFLKAKNPHHIYLNRINILYMLFLYHIFEMQEH